MMLLLSVPIIVLITSLSFMLGKVEASRMQKIASVVWIVFSFGLKSLLAVGGLVFVIIYFGMGPVRNPPIVKKPINEQYYFTEQEYGYHRKPTGKVIHLYRNKPWLIDYEVGLIDKGIPGRLPSR